MKLLSKSPHPQDSALDCIDPDDDSSGAQEPAHVADVDMDSTPDYHHDSPGMAQYSDSPFPDTNIAVLPSPTSQPPDNSICLAVDARSQEIQQTTSSSLTRSFKGNYLTTVAHNAAIADTHFHYAGDEDIDSTGESDVSLADSGDDDDPNVAHDTLSAMDIEEQCDPTELRSQALTWGIHVDPTFNLTVCLDCGVAIPWEQVYGHRRKKTQTLSDFQKIAAVQDQHFEHPAPVPPIDGMRIIPDLVKCTFQGCTSSTLFTSLKPFHKHYVHAHGKPPLALRSHIIANGHQIGVSKHLMSYIEVASSPSIPHTDALGTILAHVEKCGLYSRDTTYQPATNKRPRGALLAQTNWEPCIENVDLKSLRQTAQKPEGAPEFNYLIQQTQSYYKFIAANLG
ncbi:hypothetical protein C8R48DRAFT_776482 [Suillus tomentosus]|nr:hypothetical protein C8R48DRAFT_776482 [Suillus tomentosus]